jgi:hypothetical protein
MHADGTLDGSAVLSKSARRNTLLIGAVLLVSLLLRSLIPLWLPSLYYPDGLYQTREPAHRIAYGYGVAAWEFRDGARSLVFPAFLAGVMRATDWMGTGSDGYLFGISLVLSAISLIVVWFGFKWGYRIGGWPASIVAGLACASWYEFVYFGPKAFNEFVAGNIFLLGIYLGATADSVPGRPVRRLFLAGVLCGLVAALRMQLSPAVLVAAVCFCWKNPRQRILPVGLGLALPVLIFGFVDAVTWGYPFQSYVVNLTYNVIGHGSNPKPWYWLIKGLFMRTGPLPLLAIWGARRSPILGWIGLAILIPHSLIAHKEYRFIYPLLPMVVVLAAIAVTDWIAAANAKLKTPRSSAAVITVSALFFLSLSAAAASQFPFWREGAGNLKAFQMLSHDEKLCGLAISQHTWDYSGGYTYLHRNVPIFLFPDIEKPEGGSGTFNAMIAAKPLSAPPEGFELVKCWPGACLYRRPGQCAAGGHEYEFNEVLKGLGK